MAISRINNDVAKAAVDGIVDALDAGGRGNLDRRT